MTHNDFLELFNQVNDSIYNTNSHLNNEIKQKLGLDENKKILPFRKVEEDVNQVGNYFLDNDGYEPSIFNNYDKVNGLDKRFKKYSYKSEEERVKLINKLNAKIQKIITQHELAQNSLFEINLYLKNKEENEKFKKINEIEDLIKDNKKINRYRDLIKKPPPPLIIEYPVCMYFEFIGFESPSIIINNKPLYDLCILKKGLITAEWNKSVYLYYLNNSSNKYQAYLDSFLQWFNDNQIDMAKTETLSKNPANTKIVLPKSNTFMSNGDTWTIRYNEIEKIIKHTKGMDYIHYLMKNQKNEIPALVLYQAVSNNVVNIDKELSKVSSSQLESVEGLSTNNDSAIYMADEKTLKELRQFKKSLEEKLDNENIRTNTAEYDETVHELDQINKYLKKVSGKDGKARKAPNSKEKARQSVTKTITTAKNNIKKHHPEVFSHLKKFLKHGSFCTYNPPEYVEWDL